MEELEKRLRASCYKGVQPRVKVEKRKRDMREEKVQHRLYRSEKDKIQDVSEKNEVRREVRSEHGRVDLMTKDEVVEVKHWKDWKHALGQVKIYSSFFLLFLLVFFLTFLHPSFLFGYFPLPTRF
jgi:hypothetical protein